MERLDDRNLIDNFLQDCKLRNMSKHSIESYSSSLNLFLKFIKKDDYCFQTIDKNILEKYIEFLQNENISYKTMQNRYSAFISFYDYLVYEDKFKYNIVRGFNISHS